MADILILGGGVAGLAAAYFARPLGRETVVFEARERYGGLLDHFELDGFRFDHGVHFGFSKNEPYRALLEKTPYITHHPEPYNYEQGRWLKHPVQNNLYPLPVEEKVEAIKSFIARPELPAQEDTDYRRWLEACFGEVMAERFPARYTEKYWTVSADELSTRWVGNRLYRPSLDEVLFGAMTDQTPSTYYLPEMLYPRSGGFRAFLMPLTGAGAGRLVLRTGRKVVLINPAGRFVECENGQREYYANLVSSLPLPEVIAMLAGAPGEVREAAATLWATAVALVSIGLAKPQAGDHLWFYIYDRDILPSRVHAPYRKSSGNAPEGCSSLQFETYYSRHTPLPLSPDHLVEHVIAAAEKMGLFTRRDIVVADTRTLPYANVVFDRGMVERRDFVLAYLRELDILPVGRFGLWDYLWADQSFLSAKIVENLPGMV